MRGNIGRPGAGVLPIRGHSNVQGQRTVGITEKPELVPNDKLKELYGFEPPEKKGLNCTEAAEAIIKGEVRAMVQLGGNLVRALPDHRPAAARVAPAAADGADRDQAQQVMPGARRGVLHPALPRPDRNRPAERQAASRERGGLHRLHPRLARLCRAGERRASVRALDYRRARQSGAAAQSESRLGRLDRRLQPHSRRHRAHLSRHVQRLQQAHVAAGRLSSPAAACHREWKTKTGKANFIAPQTLTADIKTDPKRNDIFQLTTFRSQGQFNTTVYSDRDRFRGVHGTRMVLFMNENDIVRLELREGDIVGLRTAVGDDAVPPRRWLHRARLQHPAGMRRRLLPGMQSADPAVAPRQGQLRAGVKRHSGRHRKGSCSTLVARIFRSTLRGEGLRTDY